MLKKVHRRLTLLCAGVTIFILLIMTFLFLYVSESSLKKSQYLSFQRDMSTLAANFEQQTVISHEWLSKIEKNSSYLLFVIDNGIPFQFNNRTKREEKTRLMEAALSYYEGHFAVDRASSDYGSYHFEFEFPMDNKQKYYACIATFPHDNNTTTQLLVLSSIENQQKQISRQRLLFLLINFVSAIALFLFSWFFTKKLLLPIEKNRLEQLQFVSSASHELRTPLAVILSCTEAYKKAPLEDKDGFLSTIQSEGIRMSKLVDDMLLLSRADSCRFDITLEQTEPDTLLLNSYEAFEPMAKNKNISMSIHLPEEAVPPCLLDASRFSQVIAILLHNAISYTPNGGKISLSLAFLSGHPNTLIVSVADNGIGISDEEKENIFKRFYRLEKSHSSKEHFGLGLCIAAEIVAAFNGSIQVDDTKNGGSTFTVTIPVPHPVSS